MIRLIAAVVLVCATSGHAQAQNAVCIDPNTGQVDQQGTAAWDYIAQNTDAELANALTGTWYSEIPAPRTGQVSYQYQSYEPGFLFRYRDRVCGGMINTCSDFEGHGFWAVMPNGDGTMTTMLIVSDLQRDRQCIGGSSRLLDANTLQSAGGQIWRRVQ